MSITGKVIVATLIIIGVTVGYAMLLLTVNDQKQQIDQLKFELWHKGETIDYYWEHSQSLEYVMWNHCECNDTIMRERGLVK